MADKSKATFGLNKLVRDKLPAMMRAMGQEPEVVTLEGEELQRALIVKVGEELAELDPSLPSYQKELADLLQSVKDLIAVSANEAKVEELRQADLKKRGGFLTGQYIASLHLVANDEWVAYYRREPNKYPEL